MLESIALLLLCQLLGELIVIFLNIPVPGPVVGMILLFTGLVIFGEIPDKLSETANGLLEQFSLLFVPAGVGVMTHLTLLGEQWIPLSTSLIISTILTIAVTALIMQYLTGKEIKNG